MLIFIISDLCFGEREKQALPTKQRSPGNAFGASRLSAEQPNSQDRITSACFSKSGLEQIDESSKCERFPRSGLKTV